MPAVYDGSCHLSSLELEKFHGGLHMTVTNKQASNDDPAAGCFGHRHARRNPACADHTAELLETVRLAYLCVLRHGGDVEVRQTSQRLLQLLSPTLS
jgi:hypothetical protein